MRRTSKPRKATSTLKVPVDDASTSSSVLQTQAKVQLSIPFQSGPSLECILDDVLHEILSYLPTLTETHVHWGYILEPPVIRSTSLVRTPTLRALSKTSRLLRSRCLAMAWQNVELCAVSTPEHDNSFYRVLGKKTKTAMRVLKTCPHLLPLIQTVSVVFTRYQYAKVVPAFADCLTTLPNLTTIQVISANPQMTTAIKNAFQGKELASVRRIALPPSAHELIQSCPNVEEVMCLNGCSTIIGSLAKGNCQRLRVLIDIGNFPLMRLAELFPNLTHIRLVPGGDFTLLSKFPFLDTVEINLRGIPTNGYADPYVKQASEVLKKNELKAEKAVLLTRWDHQVHGGSFDIDVSRPVKQIIRV